MRLTPSNVSMVWRPFVLSPYCRSGQQWAVFGGDEFNRTNPETDKNRNDKRGKTMTWRKGERIRWIPNPDRKGVNGAMKIADGTPRMEKNAVKLGDTLNGWNGVFGKTAINLNGRIPPVSWRVLSAFGAKQASRPSPPMWLANVNNNIRGAHLSS